jgi:minor extracellular protease Epr
MWQLNRRHLLLLLALAATTGNSIAATTISPTTTLSPTTIKPTAIVVLPPTISGFSPAGTCVSKGSTVTVQGSGFGAQTGKGVALGGNGIHVDLSIASWNTTAINVVIPNDSRIQGNSVYYIGIEKADHSQWLSNISKTVTTCNNAPVVTLVPLKTVTLAPKITAASPGLGTASSSSTGGGAPPTGTAPPSAPPPDDPPPSTSDSTYDLGTTPSAPPQAGGALLSGDLPPPPKDVPAAPPKESSAIEPGELVIVSANMAEAQELANNAKSIGLSVKRRTNLAGLGFVVTVFRVPKDLAVGTALLSLRKVLPDAWADANHRYDLMGDDEKTYAQRLIGWNRIPSCGAGIKIGLVDTAIDTQHTQFQNRALHTRSFLPAGTAPAALDHGTATAGLLIGTDVGLISGAQLYAAGVFRMRDKQADTTAEWVVLALNWLAENNVGIINLSLGGPRNLLIEAAVQRLLQNGIAVVAAAGNSGADAPPVFPAAQPGVVAVTAVDADMKPYKKASRGDYISFAAPGVDVWTAAPTKDGVYVSGTSYAAPFVTAALAGARGAKGKTNWATLVKQMQTKARDLGDGGKDSIFGWGLVQTPGCGKTVTATK